ncbi:MAG: DUF3299 domain-containing protein [Burkholderiales bacterium]|nr:DUF3299 domain-containing protein [Burkholderiales bacterium]MBL6879630.1 DUF3299 domain-containing protein [Burkholderiales bacterium]
MKIPKIRMIKMQYPKMTKLITCALLLTSQNNIDVQAQDTDLSNFEEIEWTELMPAEDLEALQNPPDYIMDIEEGSAEDKVVNQGEKPTDMFFDDEYQRALLSTTVVSEMDGKAIRIPGFIVPLEFNDDKTVSQFFLVPFFGACIHVPPPPPNQVIHVTSSNGVKLENLYTPHWVSGVVNSVFIENEIASATYAMDAVDVEVYWEK